MKCEIGFSSPNQNQKFKKISKFPYNVFFSITERSLRNFSTLKLKCLSLKIESLLIYCYKAITIFMIQIFGRKELKKEKSLVTVVIIFNPQSTSCSNNDAVYSDIIILFSIVTHQNEEEKKNERNKKKHGIQAIRTCSLNLCSYQLEKLSDRCRNAM